jgi:hypothetical protein
LLVVPVVRAPGEVIEGLGRSLGVEVSVIEGFVDWLLNTYLARYPSVGLVRLVVDVLRSGDSRVVGFRRALGIRSNVDVKININDASFSRLYTAVRDVVRALAKAGLVEYIEDLGVVNLARGCDNG